MNTAANQHEETHHGFTGEHEVKREETRVKLYFAAGLVDAGAKVVRPVQAQFYGERTGTLDNPFEHVWFLATHREDLTPEEINKRAKALFKQGSGYWL